MPAVSIQDLENAKTDVDHIAEVATSLGNTATDRLGRVKQTLAGAVGSIAAITDRGVWTAGTAYLVKDYVTVAGIVYICVLGHTAGATFAGDSAKWRVYQGVLEADLANQTDPLKGVGMVGVAPITSTPTFTETLTGKLFDVLGGIIGRIAMLFSSVDSSPKWYGAKGDKTTDDRASIQAAIDAISNAGGGTLRFPKGGYRITGPLRVGLAYLDEYSFITARTADLNDATIDPHVIAANDEANRLLGHVNIVFDSGAYLLVDYTVSVPTPVLAYNILSAVNPGEAEIKNFTAVTADVFDSNGHFNPSLVTTQATNGHVGVFCSYGVKNVSDTLTIGLEHGVISLNQYWGAVENTRVQRAGGICLNVVQGNATKINQMEFRNSAKGLVFDGDAATVSNINTEQVAQDLIVYRADTSEFGPGYLEDASSTDGTGKYAVQLGTTSGTAKILHCEFKKFRCGEGRPNKGAFRIWGVANGVFAGCRAYGKSVVKDSYSYVTYDKTDFPTTAPDPKVIVLADGLKWSCNYPEGSSYITQGPWLFKAAGIATGAISAGNSVDYQYTLPASMNSLNNLCANFSYVSGGDSRLATSTRILYTTPRKVSITFSNQSTSSIDPGTAVVTISVFGAD